MHLTEPVLIIVSGVLPCGMADRLVPVAPLLQSAIDVLLIGVNRTPLGDCLLDQQTDRHLRDVLQHPDHDRSAVLQHPEDRRLLLGQGLSPPLPPSDVAVGAGGLFLQ